MHELYRLKHLRQLNFRALTHPPSNLALELAWERSMCEAFQTRSAPNIHHIDLSMGTQWDRVRYDTTWTPSGLSICDIHGRKLGETGEVYPFIADAQWPDAPFPLDEQ